MSIVFLSYTLDINTPSYGSSMSLSINYDKDMQSGDSCNTQAWNIPNHLGTHIDAPKHFALQGRTIDEYGADFWVCKKPYLLELEEIKSKELISIDHIKPFAIDKNIDLLLIKTGFSELRFNSAYSMHNPGFAPQLADYFRKEFPELKMIGFDVISLGSFAFREIGREAHKNFLDHSRPILPIEDMDLSSLGKETYLKKVIVLPLRIKSADAAPCTVIAEI